MDNRWPGSIGSVQHEEAVRLAELAKGLTVLELGSYVGRSTVAMARTARMVYAVDWHRGGHPDYPEQYTLHTFISNLDNYGMRDRVVPLLGRTADVLPVLRDDSFDFCFIDAAHTYEDAEADLRQASRLVREGARIACHDYLDLWQKDFGVGRAVDEFCAAAGWRIEEIVTSMAVLVR